MRYYAPIIAIALLSLTAPANAQEEQKQLGVHTVTYDRYSPLAPPGDLGELASRSDAIVVATYNGDARGELRNAPDIDGTGSTNYLVTIMPFTVREVVKADPRLPNDKIDILGSGDGEVLVDSNDQLVKVIRLSEDAKNLVPGNSYLLYLNWSDPLKDFTLSFGSWATFDVSGATAKLVDAGDGLLAKRFNAMRKDEFMLEAKSTALTPLKRIEQ